MPAVTNTVRVEGLRDLHRAFQVADRKQAADLKSTLRRVAEPVRVESEMLAASGIPRVGMVWSRMRVGVTQTSVYIAPRQRGSRSGRRRRPNLAGLLLDRAMVPAITHNQPRVVREVEQMLDDVGRAWERV
jgi:hypothetical protein